MESRKLPALLALVGAVVAVGLFVILKDDTADEDATVAEPAAQSGNAREDDRREEPNKPAKPPHPKLPVVEVKGGKPVGGVQELEFKSGGQAAFEVKTDAPDELHFHGYDLYIDIAPGKPTEVSFKAEIEGLFELESHSTGELLAEVSVVPA